MTTVYTNQNKSSEVGGITYNSSYTYNDSTVTYAGAVVYANYTNLTKNTSTFTNQTPSSSTWVNQTKN